MVYSEVMILPEEVVLSPEDTDFVYYLAISGSTNADVCRLREGRLS